LYNSLFINPLLFTFDRIIDFSEKYRPLMNADKKRIFLLYFSVPPREIFPL